LLRAEGVVAATPTEIKDLIYFDPDSSMEIDPTRESGSFIENIDGKVFVAYSKSKA